jgi:hypothetical protein
VLPFIFPRWPLALAAALLLCPGCAPAPGAFHADTGLTGIALRPGELAGTWAQAVTFATVVTVPVLGEQPGGGRSTRLVNRTWEAAAGEYQERFVRCTNEVFEVAGTQTLTREDVLQRIAPAHYRSAAREAEGFYQAPSIADVWGARNLPDPVQTPLPTKDDYQIPPGSERIWDEDEDGHPGVTIYLRGTLSADLYVVKRSVYTFDGTVVAPDRILGLARQEKNESNAIDSTVSWLKGESGAQPDPDPKKSWFEMVRLPLGAGCAEVAQAVAEGRLQVEERPF